MNDIQLSDKEFDLFSKLIFAETGISLPHNKKYLVQNRLLKRLSNYNFKKFSDYYRFIQINKAEKTEMINQITTNETYFFREIEHFKFLKELISNYSSITPFRVWSAAASNGAEAYSIAMLLDSYLKNWEILGTDINSEVVKTARRGLYPIKWVDKIPDEYKKKYCLKGKGSNEGWFLIDRVLSEKITFEQYNLLNKSNEFGMFDVIFLRNVLIYFDDDTKKLVINNVLKNLKKGGYFIISLTEHISALNIQNLKPLKHSIYQKV